MAATEVYLEDDPYWYKDAIIYELHVKSFFDSSGDGKGDFRGVTEKLDYLEGLGVTAIWLLPFYPSPLRDDGYDIAEYFGINPDYGTLRDFRRFLKEAHRRGIRVITELVINHTSDQHSWFKRARTAKPGSAWRDFYVWSDSPDKYKETRIIFKDFEASNWAWDPVAKSYYWHRFYSHQPDLNFDNPRVQKEIMRVMDFWFGMGVDGMRLDAIPYLYEREGTNCENLQETHEFLKKLRSHVDEHFQNRMLLAEANQWPEDAVAYLGDGDECHMAFHFPVMPRLFMAMRMEDRFPVVDILEQTPDLPNSCQWAMFLRNHDELTLEMVTDEERDYMYRFFAKDSRARINLGIRRRLAPLLDNNRKKIELMNIVLFSLPGTPVIYYGDEIGMGDNYYLGDRDGVRTPMQWSSDRNAGFSKSNPHKLYLPVIIDPEYHYEAINVETQDGNVSSLLWWMKRVIAMRKRYKAFSRGRLKFLFPDNPKILAFIRAYEDETILVVINLSRFSQVVEIDLSEYKGYVPEELFSQNKFPTIRETPYLLTLGPHSNFWLLLEKEMVTVTQDDQVPQLKLKGTWEMAFEQNNRKRFERILPAYLNNCRWFGGKAREINNVKIQITVPIPRENPVAHLLVVEVKYATGSPDSYVIPLAFATETKAAQIKEKHRESIIAELHLDDEGGLLYDGIYQEEFRRQILDMISRRKKLKGRWGELAASRGKQFQKLADGRVSSLNSKVLKAEQSNSSVLYDNTFFLKLYRRMEEGMNPDPEVVRFLTESNGFDCVPPFAGSLEFRRPGQEPQVITLLQGFVPNEGDAWTITLDALGRYLERILARKEELSDVTLEPPSAVAVEPVEIPELLQELIGGVTLEHTERLGQRTAEMHLALSKVTGDANFDPEPFSTLYQKSLYQSLRNDVRRGLHFLAKNVTKLPDSLQDEAQSILTLEGKILRQLKRVMDGKISGLKTRIHGDYHLGQVLFTGKDFIIIDFEGEPARSPSERRLKYSPFRDVAGMIRSYHYAVYNRLFHHASIRPTDSPFLEPWLDAWFRYVCSAFLGSYLKTANEAAFLPKEQRELEILLQAFLLNKAIYEIGYELNNRPDWLVIPIRGINMVLEEAGS